MSITQSDPTQPWVLPGTGGSDSGLVSGIGSTSMSSDSRLVIGLIVGLAVFIVLVIFLSLFRKYDGNGSGGSSSNGSIAYMQLEQPPETADGVHSIKLSEGYNPIATSITTTSMNNNKNTTTSNVHKVSYQNRRHNIHHSDDNDESIGPSINDNPRESLIKGDEYITLPIG